MTNRKSSHKEAQENDRYNWLSRKRTKLDDLPEPETDESQLEALMVDCGRTKLLQNLF